MFKAVELLVGVMGAKADADAASAMMAAADFMVILMFFSTLDAQ